jgi:hypothetical protein
MYSEDTVVGFLKFCYRYFTGNFNPYNCDELFVKVSKKQAEHCINYGVTGEFNIEKEFGK